MGPHRSTATVGSSVFLFSLLLLPFPSPASVQVTSVHPGFNGTQMNWIDNRGFFLLSPNKTFAFGFHGSPNDPNLFNLIVQHQASQTVVWTANRHNPVTSGDLFLFSPDGDVRLQLINGSRAWSTGTVGKNAYSLELREDGNLMLLDRRASPLWQSFQNPTDTLLTGQNFSRGMELVSEPGDRDRIFRLVLDSGGVVLRAGFRSPQTYWSIWNENRRMDQVSTTAEVATAAIVGNYWNFYDRSKKPLTRLQIQSSFDGNASWAALLRKDGFIVFTNLADRSVSGTKVPERPCDTPDSCSPYQMCSDDRDTTNCECPPELGSPANCDPGASSACSTKAAMELNEVQDVGYFALGLTTAASRGSELASCQGSCSDNCSCVALFFDEKTKDCFLFDEIGSLKSSKNSGNLRCFLKVRKRGGGGSKATIIVVTISVLTFFVVASILFIAIRIHGRRIPQRDSTKQLVVSSVDEDDDGDDDLLGSISGMPVRYSYAELQKATGNFSEKLGHGGFGSVYLGTLPDGSRIAVKKLESIGQGRKEFRAEVCIIGSIHHHHLVKLRGFCSEGHHRLLAYEFMANGSLDRWLFRRSAADPALDWDTRYAIAVGTAKGLAYLHADCDAKIVHCDIKPENVLLDEHFQAKVSDFGLAKLMTREQSNVFTTLRGTRGYLAPEWIISSAISEKSDVYSFGMVLLEIVAGRKSFDVEATSERAHLPTFAFKMVEEGRVSELLDDHLLHGRAGKDESVELAVKVALWCIQEDVSLRPSMGKVVQMLEGVAEVPPPPPSSHIGYRLYASMLKNIGEKGLTTSSSSAPSIECNSDVYQSAVRLSGPR